MQNERQVAPHDGCVDWNLEGVFDNVWDIWSHPTMGAWIEMRVTPKVLNPATVAPHDGCVDWNFSPVSTLQRLYVAPHDGCVDWNI